MGGYKRRFRWAIGVFCSRDDTACSKKTNDGQKWSKNQVRHDAPHVHCHGYVRMHETAGKWKHLHKASLTPISLSLIKWGGVVFSQCYGYKFKKKSG